MWMSAFYFGSGGVGQTLIVESLLLSVPSSPILSIKSERISLAGNEPAHTIAVDDKKEVLKNGGKLTLRTT